MCKRLKVAGCGEGWSEVVWRLSYLAYMGTMLSKAWQNLYNSLIRRSLDIAKSLSGVIFKARMVS